MSSDSKAPKSDKRKPPVHIPLDFETAIEGLLQVDPKSPEKAEKPKKGAKKKPGQK